MPMRQWPAPKGAEAWGCGRGPWGRLGGCGHAGCAARRLQAGIAAG